MEKLALAVVTATRKLRPYFQYYSIIVMTSQPFRTILHSPSQSGRLTKWAIELSEYNIEYKPRTSSKAQVLADFVIELVPKEDSSSSNTKWILHVDGASSKQGSGIGIQLESPTGEMIEQSFRPGFSASNNKAEYESLIVGLRLARSVSAREISAFNDSRLVTSQFHGEYEAKNERMEAYLSVLQEIAQQFDKFELTKIPRGDNTSADVLAALASTSNPAVKRIIPVEGIDKPSINLPRKEIDLLENNPPRIDAITTRSGARRESQGLDNENNDEPDSQSAPSTSRVRTRRTATTAAIPEEAVHDTCNEAHEAFKKELEARPDWRVPIFKYIKDDELPTERWEARKIKARSSRYCIMEERLYKISQDEPYLLGVSPKDAFTILKQTHGGVCGSHSGGRSLAIRIKKLGYFWPTITDDSEQFALKCDKCQRHAPMIHQLTQKLSTISSPYPFMKWSMDVIKAASPRYPKCNVHAEAENKTIMNNLKKRLDLKKERWGEELHGVLWAYRTTPHTATGETPFSLSYGIEAVIPAEIEVPSQRRGICPEDAELNEGLLIHQLDMIEERREKAAICVQNYQQAAARYYD
ncbi:uncharacterized protein LOC106412722 [Brassica napus]|uniref:uncharacterized protein LOC106412722 n=1 Tax=Brassica napus TaxID=3708 RepID=UPI0006AAD3B8|nr:uncharacterized protein LOC106412722 [Brassica napus]